MAYFSDLGTGAITFPGYVTFNWAIVCTSSTIVGPVAYNATASKQGMLKDNMKPTTATGLRFCAGTAPSVNKHKYTGGTAAGWYPLCSLARPTAYTAAMKVSGGSMAVVASSAFVNGRFWMDAYNSTGVRQMSAGPVTVASPTTAPGNMVGVFATTQFVTVPVGGYLVARISCQGSTARLYYGPSGATPALPAGATRTFYWNPTEVSAGPTSGPMEYRHRFFDSTGVALPDGTKVYEYDATTFAYTGFVALIGGVAVGAQSAAPEASASAVGVGEATFIHNGGDAAEYFYVIPDTTGGITWVTATAKTVGQRINPAGIGTLHAEVQSIAGTGTTGATEPVWPTVVGSTVVDNAGVNQITWVMVQAETLCTDAITGVEKGLWTAGMTGVIAAVGPVVAATRIDPAGAGQYALCTVAGTAAGVIPTWPTTIVSGVTTIVDGGITWTMYDNEVYV